MKTIIGFLVCLLLVLQGQAQMIPKDKQLHLGAGAVVGAWGMAIPNTQKDVKQICFGLGCATIAGAGKEIVDAGGFGTPDIKDFAATVSGAVISTGIIIGVKHIIHTVKKHKTYKNKYGTKF